MIKGPGREGGVVMQIYECDLLAVCHHPDHRHCDIRDVFLFCLLISHDNMFKGDVNLWEEAPQCKLPPYHVC